MGLGALSFRRASPAGSAPTRGTTTAAARPGVRQLRLRPAASARRSCLWRWLFGNAFFLCLPAGALPILPCQRCIFARAFGFPLGFFQALAGAPKLVFRKPHTLAGHVSLQLGSFDDLRRPFIPGRSILCGENFAACFFHGSICEWDQSHTSRRRLPPHRAAVGSGTEP